MVLNRYHHFFLSSQDFWRFHALKSGDSYRSAFHDHQNFPLAMDHGPIFGSAIYSQLSGYVFDAEYNPTVSNAALHHGSTGTQLSLATSRLLHIRRETYRYLFA